MPRPGRRRAGRPHPGGDVAEDGKHLQADDGGGSVHVGAQRVQRPVVGDGEVAAHGGEEVLEVAVRDAVAVSGVGHGGDDGVAAGPAVDRRAEVVREGLQSLGAVAGLPGGGREVVDDVVGEPGEGVEGVHGGTAGGGQQPSGEEVRLAVSCVEAAAALECRT